MQPWYGFSPVGPLRGALSAGPLLLDGDGVQQGLCCHSTRTPVPLQWRKAHASSLMTAPKIMRTAPRRGALSGTVHVLTEEDLEDARRGAEVLERIRSGKERTYSLDEVMAELGLDSSDL
jgi:hypothetical protein